MLQHFYSGRTGIFFESMIRQLEEYPVMKQLLKAVLFQGKRVSYNPDLAEEELTNAIYDKAQGNKFQFLSGDQLNMDLVIEKFVLYFQDIYGDKDEKFLEEQGRKLFLLYLKPHY